MESSNHEYGTTLLIALLLSFGLPAIGGPITSPAASLLPYGAALLALAAIAATLAVRLAVRKRALALEIERLALAAAIEQSGESIVICDPAGTIQHVSAAFTRMTGYTSEEVIGRTPRMLKSGRQDPAFYRELWSTITAGKTWRGRLVNRRKDGACYTEEMTITPVRDTNGMTVAYTAIKRDVTNGRTGESAGRFLAALEDSSEDAIVNHTPGGAIQSWNRGAETLFGYRAEEVVGKDVTMLMPPEELYRFAGVLGRICSGERISLEAVGLGKGSRRFDASLVAYPIREESGGLAAITVIVRDITARKAAEQSRNRLALIVDSSDDAIFAVTLDGGIASWNNAAEVIYGYRAEEIIGRHVITLAPPDRKEEVMAILNSARTGSKLSHFETVRMRKDGGLVDVALTISPIVDDSGQIIGKSTIARDITKKKRADAALRNSEQRFRGAFEHAPYGMALTTLDGRFLQVNETLCAMVGYSAPELLSRGWHDLTHPDDLSANLKAVEQVRQSAVSLEIEKRYIHKQGHSVWVCIRISRLLAAEAGPADVIIHVEDVTERKRIEEAVRRSEEKYRRLVDNLPDVTWTATATGRPIHISANVETVIGYTAKEVCESSDSLWFRVVHPDDIGRVRRALEGLFAANCPFDVEYRVRRRDGEWIWVRDRSSRIFVQEGVAYADGVFSDVTARRTAAEALAASEQRYRQLFESNLAGVFRALPNGRLIECNESLARIAGYDSAAAILEPARQTSSWTAVRRARWIGFSASGVW